MLKFEKYFIGIRYPTHDVLILAIDFDLRLIFLIIFLKYFRMSSQEKLLNQQINPKRFDIVQSSI